MLPYIDSKYKFILSRNWGQGKYKKKKKKERKKTRGDHHGCITDMEISIHQPGISALQMQPNSTIQAAKGETEKRGIK